MPAVASRRRVSGGESVRVRGGESTRVRGGESAGRSYNWYSDVGFSRVGGGE